MKKVLIAALAALTLYGCSRSQEDDFALRYKNMRVERESSSKKVKKPSTGKPLSYADIVQFALEHNFEFTVLQDDIAMYGDKGRIEKLNLLPVLAAAGEFSYDNRGPLFAERGLNTYDFPLMWDVLDSGLSYYNARELYQTPDLINYRFQRLRKKLILEVTEAYWDAVISKSACETASGIIAMARSRQQKNIYQDVSRLESLEIEALIVNIEENLRLFEKNYARADAELKVSMGLHSIAEVNLKSLKEASMDQFEDGTDGFVETAFLSSPGFVDQDLNFSDLIDKTQKTVMKDFSGTVVFDKRNVNNDQELLNYEWWKIAVKASRDLLSFPAYIRDYNVYNEEERLPEVESLATFIGVLTQVNIAYLEYGTRYVKYQDSREFADNGFKLLQVHEGESEFKGGLSAKTLDLTAEAFFAKVNSRRAYADMMISLVRLGNSFGKPFYFIDEVKAVKELLSSGGLIDNNQSIIAQIDDLLKQINIASGVADPVGEEAVAEVVEGLSLNRDELRVYVKNLQCEIDQYVADKLRGEHVKDVVIGAFENIPVKEIERQEAGLISAIKKDLYRDNFEL